MDQLHNWFNLKPGVRDTEFCTAVAAYLDALKERGEIAGYRISRRKLALGPPELGAVNQQVSGLRAALYRDFPDAQRKRGEERF